MDIEKDVFIKEKLQEDKLISKKANDLFSKLNTGELFLETNDEHIKNTNPTNNHINNVNKFATWKRILATAASFFVVTGVANVYATSKGYQNIFFMIKYYITGSQEAISQRDDILFDKDLTISFEQINIAKGLSITVSKFQIINNEAKLIVSTSEEDILDKSAVPLRFKIFNSENKLLCEKISDRNEQNSEYTTDELILKDFVLSDKILNLEIYKANSQKIVTLIINLDERKVEVLGEKEALQKISEIELKKYLGSIADFSKPANVKGNGECINITNISYFEGLYKVNYTYFYRESTNNKNFNVDNYDIYEQSVYISLNNDKSYSKFKLVDMENPTLIKEADKKNNTTIITENTTSNKTKDNNTTKNNSKINTKY